MSLRSARRWAPAAVLILAHLASLIAVSGGPAVAGPYVTETSGIPWNDVGGLRWNDVGGVRWSDVGGIRWNDVGGVPRDAVRRPAFDDGRRGRFYEPAEVPLD